MWQNIPSNNFFLKKEDTKLYVQYGFHIHRKHTRTKYTKMLQMVTSG